MINFGQKLREAYWLFYKGYFLIEWQMKVFGAPDMGPLVPK